MNANVQVAFVSVLATTITTLGVVGSAYLSSRKIKNKVSEFPAEQDIFDDRDILERLLVLIKDNERKDKQIQHLQNENAKLKNMLEP